MNRKNVGVGMLLWLVAGCAPISDLEQLQSNNTSLLQQQAVRLEMHEEYLAQLAESQQELVTLLARVDARTQQIKARLPKPASAQKTADREPLAEQLPKQVSADDVQEGPQNKLVVGRNEWVWLELMNRNLKARVDTGALSSSLSAIDVLPFERNGKEWVRFRVPDEDHPDGGDVYETPLIRYVRIRQASLEELERRPVIRLIVRMGDYVDQVEFNLSDRENMLYPVLLGRNFLRDMALVDVARKFTQPKYTPDEASAQTQ